MKQFKGLVKNTSMTKTAVVVIETLWQHQLYKKRFKREKKVLAHYQSGVNKGDKVIIQECRPISKRKRFKIIKVIQ
jgi:small subunit ribosomal protein S17